MGEHKAHKEWSHAYPAHVSQQLDVSLVSHGFFQKAKTPSSQKKGKKSAPKSTPKGKQPRGRAPKGMIWNRKLQKWEPSTDPDSIPKPKPKSTKPRGRPPRGMDWDEKSEQWVFVEEEG